MGSEFRGKRAAKLLGNAVARSTQRAAPSYHLW